MVNKQVSPRVFSSVSSFVTISFIADNQLNMNSNEDYFYIQGVILFL